MLEGFLFGLLATVLKIFAFICLVSWVLQGFDMGWGVTAFLLVAGSSWFKYLNQQTVRVRD